MDYFYDTFVVLLGKTFTFYCAFFKIFPFEFHRRMKVIEVWYLRPKQNLRLDLDLRLDI